MQKTYQKPEIKVTHIETTHMLAASEKVGFGSSVSSGYGAESRKFSFDEDNEE